MRGLLTVCAGTACLLLSVTPPAAAAVPGAPGAPGMPPSAASAAPAPDAAARPSVPVGARAAGAAQTPGAAERGAVPPGRTPAGNGAGAGAGAGAAGNEAGAVGNDAATAGAGVGAVGGGAGADKAEAGAVGGGAGAVEGGAAAVEAGAAAVGGRAGADKAEAGAVGGGAAAVGGGADLEVGAVLRAVAGAPVRKAVQETFEYAVTVTNHGPSAARQVVVTDRLPAALEFVSSRDGCAPEGRDVRCGPLALLPVGRSHTWVLTVRLAASYEGDGSDIVNEALVGAETADPDAGNNTTSLTGLKIPPNARTADLALTKTALLERGRTWVRPGEKFTYRITVRNQGPATARQVRVTDLLPAPLVLLSSPDDCEPAPGGGRRVVCPAVDRLAAGESVEFRITVRVADGDDRANPPRRDCAPLDNIARVTSASFDPDLSDNANRPGTTAPGGGPLCLRRDGGGGHDGGHGDDGNDGHHDGEDCPRDHGHEHGQDQGRDDDHQHGRGDLAESGAPASGALMWAAGGLVTAGAVLRTAAAARRGRRTGTSP
ncbi:DUF11 domain-containing protein [Streptomyces sp. NPDC006670]|uniref:DUF11 domain-containing protein n=1 Tax=Streptomyces sp. NPDC006670 TaxID=3154476 RepID=UPI00340D1A6C